MLKNVNLETNRCQFEQCINFEDGYCLNDNNRKDCVEMAMAILCIDTEKMDD